MKAAPRGLSLIHIFTAAFDSEIRKTIFHFYREQILTNNIFPYIIIIAVLGIWNNAGVAQLVEQLIRNQQVSGSSPVSYTHLDVYKRQDVS